MAKQTTLADWIDETAYDQNHDKIGTITDIYVDNDSNRPEFLTIEGGWFGQNHHFVPIEDAQATGDGITVAFTKEHIKDAPSVDADGRLTPEDEARLYRHYDVSAGESTSHDRMTTTGNSPKDTSETGTTGEGVTRSEEELEVDTRTRDAGQVRLRKYVVTEDVNLKVPVRKEVARVTREPAKGTTAGAISDEDTDEVITLREEEVVVDKQTVAKERVGVETDIETDYETVSDTVRKERVDVEGDVKDDAKGKGGTSHQRDERRR